MREYILAEQLHGFTRSQKWQAAVLPFGATEPHNLHMPYGTDTLQVEEIGRRACEYAYKAGAKVVLLPAVPFGVNTNHLKVVLGQAAHEVAAGVGDERVDFDVLDLRLEGRLLWHRRRRRLGRVDECGGAKNRQPHEA